MSKATVTLELSAQEVQELWVAVHNHLQAVGYPKRLNPERKLILETLAGLEKRLREMYLELRARTKELVK